jgi:hypothetical protein
MEETIALVFIRGSNARKAPSSPSYILQLRGSVSEDARICGELHCMMGDCTYNTHLIESLRSTLCANKCYLLQLVYFVDPPAFGSTRGCTGVVKDE